MSHLLPPTELHRTHPLLGAFAVALALAWCAIATYSVFPALPHNPVSLSPASARRFVMYVPQGWSFFTRDPREERMWMYVRRNGMWGNAGLAPHGRLSNVVGLRRKSRAQGVETALLISHAQGEPPIPCSGPVLDCLSKLTVGQAITNTSPRPTLCGSVAIVLQRPVPWAWLRSRRTIHMPARIIPLEVTC